MEKAMIYLEEDDPHTQELAEQSAQILTSLADKNLSVGNIDWILTKAKALLAYATFQGIDYPRA